MASQPPESVTVGTFTGIKNVVSEERLKTTELASAINVDIDDVGQLRRRRGYSLIDVARYHSANTIAGRTFVVKNGVLGTLAADYGFTPITEVGPETLCYTSVADTVYFSNDRVSGKVLGDGTYAPWGTQLDQWVSPVIRPTDTLGQVSGKLLGATPRATSMESYKGRIYLANGRLIWYTELFLYDLVDKNRNYIQVESDVTFMMAVDDGIYVGTEAQLLFLQGSASPGLKLSVMRNTPCLRGSCVRVPYAKVLPEARQTTVPDGEGPVFMTSEGICVGTEGGNVFNLTQTNVVFPPAGDAAAMYREDSGVNSYVATTNAGGTPSANARIGDYADAEIVRASQKPPPPPPFAQPPATIETIQFGDNLVGIVVSIGEDDTPGFGWVDYSDLDAPLPLMLPEGVHTQVIRDLAPTPSNTNLKDEFRGHVFWDGTKIVPRALEDVISISLVFKIAPLRIGGTLTVGIIAGDFNIAPATHIFTTPVGVPEDIRLEVRVACRASFMANGGLVMLTPSVPCILTEFSPEFYPESIA